jgi:hypothetical protein
VRGEEWGEGAAERREWAGAGRDVPRGRADGGVTEERAGCGRASGSAVGRGGAGACGLGRGGRARGAAEVGAGRAGSERACVGTRGLCVR